MRGNSSRLFKLVHALLFLATTPLSATLVTSAITGHVTSNRAPAAGVTVTATSTALLHARTTTTSASGAYWIDALPPGEYDITFARAHLTTLTRRTVVELGRVARADAALEPNEDEDAVTSTAKSIDVAETTAITAHLSDAALDRLPLRREPLSSTHIIPFTDAGTVLVDDTLSAWPHLIADDAYEEITVFRGALPAEFEHAFGTAVVTRTRSGGEDLKLSLRDTMTNQGWVGGPAPTGAPNNGVDHLVEATAGGHVVPERLWFFAALWAGDKADYAFRDIRGLELKLSSQLGTSQNLVASYVNGDTADTSPFPISTSQLSLHWTAGPDARSTVELLGDRSTAGDAASSPTRSEDWLVAKATRFFTSARSEHLFSLGGSSTIDDRDDSSSSLYASDRWSVARFTFNLGARYEQGDEERITPRLAATYDLFGDGRRAAIASYSEYDIVKETTLGYASAIGASGLVRVDGIRRDRHHETTNILQIDAAYRLFDRFEAGANFAYQDLEGSSQNVANGWISAELPFGTHTFGATLLQRHQSNGPHHWPTDVGLRYSIPFSKIHLTAALDAIEVAQDTRAFRVWIRVRS